MITHEILTTPKKKCNGSLLGFFKSPAKSSPSPRHHVPSSSPLNPIASSSTSSQSTNVGDSQEIQQFSSPGSSVRHPTCSSTPLLPSVNVPSDKPIPQNSSCVSSGTTPHSSLCIDVSSSDTSTESKTDITVAPRRSISGTLSAMSRATLQASSPSPADDAAVQYSPASPCHATNKARSSAAKTLFKSPGKCSGSEDEDLFGKDFDDLGDLNYAEIDISLTQITDKQCKVLPDKSEAKFEEKKLSSPKAAPKKTSKKRVRNPEPSNVNVILDHVLGEDHNAYLEEEVSRLYQDRNENVDSTNVSNITKLDKLLERSCKSSTRTTPRHDDSLAEMLEDLGRSPSPSLSVDGGMLDITPPPLMASPHGASPELPAFDMMESPPRHVPDMLVS